MLNITSGPEIFHFWGLHGLLLPQNSLEKVGGFAPRLFQWVLRWERAVQTSQIYDYRPGNFIEQPKVGAAAPRRALEKFQMAGRFCRQKHRHNL